MQEKLFKKLPEEYHKRLIVQEINWSDALQTDQTNLQSKLNDKKLRYLKARNFLISYLGDTISYQIFNNNRTGYDSVHQKFADGLKSLAKRAGDDAPLIIIAHSLGSVISSNYLYDLQYHFPGNTKISENEPCGDPPEDDNKDNLIEETLLAKLRTASPLEQGKTLMWFFTMGCPLAIYNMRYQEPPFGLPIRVPAPGFSCTHQNLHDEDKRYWLNFYDPDDIIGYPLTGLTDKDIPDHYAEVVEDRPVEVGDWFSAPFQGMTPFAHNFYWTHSPIIKAIAEKIKYTLDLL